MSYLGPKEVVDNALNENTEDPAFVAGARVLAETKSHISEVRKLYDWNSFATALLDLGDSSSPIIRPRWRSTASHLKSVAKDLLVHEGGIVIVYDNSLVELERAPGSFTQNKRLAICQTHYPAKWKLQRQKYLKRTPFDNSYFFSERRHPVIGLDGQAYLVGGSYPLRVFGVPKVMLVELGINSLWAVSAENGSLYTFSSQDYQAQTRQEIEVNHIVPMVLAKQFFGLKIRRVSSVLDTAVLTTTGAIFITGPSFDHLPAPPMIPWTSTQDKIVEVAIGFNMLVFLTSWGRLYRAHLDTYWQDPVLIFDDETTPIKSIRFCGNRTFLAVSRSGRLFIWKENPPPGINRVDVDYPPALLDLQPTPCPIAVPWRVDSADYHRGFLAIASVRRFSYNAIFADFLNRAALKIVRTSALLSTLALEMDEPVNFLSSKPRLQKEYQLYNLQGYGTSDFGGTPHNLYLSSGSSTPRLDQSMYYSPRPSDLLAYSSLRQSTASGYATPNSYVYGRGRMNRNRLKGSLRMSVSRPLNLSRSSQSDSEQDSAVAAYLMPSQPSAINSSSGIASSSGASESPLHDTSDDYFEDESAMFQFNTRLLAIYDMPGDTKEEEFEKKLAFCKLYEDFSARALEVVKIIIEELALEDEQKTYSSLPSAGGVAGGEKYLIDGNIFVKLCVDNNSLYGGNEWSSKIANLELHGSDAYAWCFPLLPKDHKLRVPLLTMIDYGGFRALVSIACPISKRTIVYGSNDAAATVHNSDPEAERSMHQCAFLLNLAPHQVINGNGKVMASAVDVEVHRGDDGFLYILDTARVFPPMAPGASKSIVLGHSLDENLVASRDLSEAQSRSLRKDLDSVPLSEGQLFFRRTKTSVEDNISALRYDVVENERERLREERDRMGFDPDIPLASERTGLLLENLRGPLVQDDEEIRDDHLPQRVPESPHPFIPDRDAAFFRDSLASFEAPPEDSYINHIATALLGRLVLGEAWFLANEMGQRLWHQFRPEFVMGYNTPLSSDALSGFAVDGQEHDEDVRKATDYIDHAYMVLVKAQLISTSPYIDTRFMHRMKRLEQHDRKLVRLMPLIYSPATIVRFMHSVGLNIRHIGNVRVASSVRAIHDICLMEMVSRVCTSFVKRRLRAAHSLFATVQYRVANKLTSSTSDAAEPTSDPNIASSSAPSGSSNTGDGKAKDSRQRNATGDLADWDKLDDEEVAQLANKTLDEIRSMLAIQAYATLFTHSATASFFWSQVIKVQLMLKFGGNCLFPLEVAKSHDLRDNVHFATLFQIVSRRTGIIWDAESRRELEVAQWSRLPFELSADRIVGYNLSSKGSKLSSLVDAKRNLFSEYFSDTVDSTFKFPDNTIPQVITAKFYNEYFHDGQNYESQLVTEDDDPLLNACKRDKMNVDSATAVNSPIIGENNVQPVENSNGPVVDDKKLKKEPDGLDLYHQKVIAFYEKWCSSLEAAGLVVPALDRVRLLVARIRPLLDSKCPGGEADLKFVEDSLKDIPRILAEGGASHLNCELLANIYCARGQYHHLKGELMLAETCYTAALDVLTVPTFGDTPASAFTSDYGGNWKQLLVDRGKRSSASIMQHARWHYGSRRSIPHPLVIIIVDKLLTIHLEHCGTVIYAYPYWSLFRTSWNCNPFLGNVAARKRLFNGHHIPLAMNHPYAWEYSWNAMSNETQRVNEPYLAHLNDAILPLESPEVQYWLSQVLGLESTCSFDYGTHWLMPKPSETGFSDFTDFGSTPCASNLPTEIPAAKHPIGADPSSQPQNTLLPHARPLFPHQLRYLIAATALPHFINVPHFKPMHSHPAWFSSYDVSARAFEDCWQWSDVTTGTRSVMTEMRRLSGSSALEPFILGHHPVTVSRVKPLLASDQASIGQFALAATFRKRFGLSNLQLGRYITVETGPSHDSTERLDLLNSILSRIKRVRKSLRDSMPPSFSDSILENIMLFAQSKWGDMQEFHDIFIDEIQQMILDIMEQAKVSKEKIIKEKVENVDNGEPLSAVASSSSGAIDHTVSSSSTSTSSSSSSNIEPKAREKSNDRILVPTMENGYWHGMLLRYHIGHREENETSSQNAIIEMRSLVAGPHAGPLFQVGQTQYLDPSQPAPRRFLVNMTQRPEMYHITALPPWFDERGVRAIEILYYQQLTSGSDTHMITSPFICLTKNGEVSLSVDFGAREPIDSDWKMLKAFDLAGEEITSIILSQPEQTIPNRQLPDTLSNIEMLAATTVRSTARFSWLFEMDRYFETPQAKKSWDVKRMATMACVTRSGRLFIWGANKRGLLGFGSANLDVVSHPRVVASLFHQHIIDAKCGPGHIVTLSKTGSINFWGSVIPLEATDYFSEDGINRYTNIHQERHRPSEKELPLLHDALPQHAIAISSAAFGFTVVSQYGIPYYYGIMPLSTVTHDFVRILTPERITSVASGFWHTVMLSEQGNVYAWGANDSSQCGTPLPSFFIDGTARCLKALEFDWYRQGYSNNRPVFVQVAASMSFSAALTQDGDVWVWGGSQHSCPYRIPVPAPVKSLNFTHEGKLLLITEDMEYQPKTLPLVPLEAFAALTNNIKSIRRDRENEKIQKIDRQMKQSDMAQEIMERTRRELEEEWSSRKAVKQPAVASSSLQAESNVAKTPISTATSHTSYNTPPTSKGTASHLPEPETYEIASPHTISTEASDTLTTSGETLTQWQQEKVTDVVVTHVPHLTPTVLDETTSAIKAANPDAIAHAIQKMIQSALHPVIARLDDFERRLKKIEADNAKRNYLDRKTSGR